MNDILREFYMGNIDPVESIVPKTKKYLSIQDEAAELRSKLEATLNEDERVLLNKLIEKKNEDSMYYGSESFISGYKLGVKMIFEVFAKENDDDSI